VNHFKVNGLIRTPNYDWMILFIKPSGKRHSF
jgi:hypothetical protein